MSIGLQSKYLS